MLAQGPLGLGAQAPQQRGPALQQRGIHPLADVHAGLVQQLDQGAGAGPLGGLQGRPVPAGSGLGAVALHQEIEFELVGAGARRAE